MVLVKITDGIETRRLHVTPGETTFQQLQEKIVLLFPGSNHEASSLTLRYHDSDGDVITLSTNEEFQEVLSDLPSDYLWKLHIHKTRQYRTYNHLQSSFTPRRYLHWSQLDLELDKQLKELIELFLRFCDTSSSEEEPTTESNIRISPQESSTSEGSAEPSSTGNRSVKSSEAALQEEEVKHKKASGLKCPAGHHCHVICGSPPCLGDCSDPSCSLQ